MPRTSLSTNVFDEAVNRMVEVYEGGHRVVVSFSGGKDSGVCVEICVIAATITGRLPVEVLMRDEEVMYPGTIEYAERMAQRPEIKFCWLYAGQPVLNVYNREMPYYWVFDPLLDPEEWVRQPPPYAIRIGDYNIQRLTITDRFPVEEGKYLVSVIGIRALESRNRLLGIHSAGGAFCAPDKKSKVWGVRPIYDWNDGNVWKAHNDNKWDYNEAYDVMARLGIPRARLRIAPPAMHPASARSLGLAARAWPKWFDKVCKRLPGVRQAAHYGQRAVQPIRHLNESWEQCFQRVNIDEAPAWIAQRAQITRDRCLASHSRHSDTPFPDVQLCHLCSGGARSWWDLTLFMYTGDPFASTFTYLPYVEPKFFRPRDKKWGGTPTFK